MHGRHRRQGLIVRQLGDETVVYDTQSHQAHCLDRTAGEVFRRCDGGAGVAEIASALGDELGTPVGEATVLLAIDQLNRARLLEPDGAATGSGRLSRRRLLRLASAAAVPLVTSLVAPTPVEAAATCLSSCGPSDDGQPCGFPTCSGVCSGGTCT